MGLNSAPVLVVQHPSAGRRHGQEAFQAHSFSASAPTPASASVSASGFSARPCNLLTSPKTALSVGAPLFLPGTASGQGSACVAGSVPSLPSVVADAAGTMPVFVSLPSGRTVVMSLNPAAFVQQVKFMLQDTEAIPVAQQRIVLNGKVLDGCRTLADCAVQPECTLHLMLGLDGGMDFQNRHGSKPGSGGEASAQQAAIDRRERLRKLALETIDLAKDPYFMTNHIGQYECRLCLTLHPNEGNYLAHTQGKRHQENLARREFLDRKNAAAQPEPRKRVVTKKTRSIKIGRPGYKVIKHKDVETGERSLQFEIHYPEIEEGLQPRHRFMSAFEQSVEPPNKNYQYLLFAADPYETIAFKIPNLEVDRTPGKFSTDWNKDTLTFTLSVAFKERRKEPVQAPVPGKMARTYYGRTV